MTQTASAGCTPCAAAAPKLYCTIMSDTFGVLWRAGSGTVDPWTKNQIVCSNASLRNHAAQVTQQQGGGDFPCLCFCKTYDCVNALATCVLTKSGADPSQWLCGLKNSVSSFTASFGATTITVILLAVIAFAIFSYIGKK